MTEATSAAGGPPDTTPDVVRSLLEIGVAGPRRPLDDLLDVLEVADDPEARLLELLRGGAVEDLPAPRDLIAGNLPLKRVVEVKEAVKSALRQARSREQIASLTGWYLLSIASACAHHGEWISGLSHAEMVDAFAEVASFLRKSPVSRLLSEAGEAMASDVPPT